MRWCIRGIGIKPRRWQKTLFLFQSGKMVSLSKSKLIVNGAIITLQCVSIMLVRNVELKRRKNSLKTLVIYPFGQILVYGKVKGNRRGVDVEKTK